MTKRVQQSAALQIPRAAFERAVREVLGELSAASGAGSGFKMRRSAVDALHAGTEDFLTDLNRQADKYAAHANRVTLMKKGVVAAIGDCCSAAVAAEALAK